MKIDGLPTSATGTHARRPPESTPGRTTTRGDLDCVIVGAARPAWRPRSSTATASASSKILLLDPLRDFGGDSHRNEFHIGDTTILRNGGTVNLDTVTTWNEPAGALLDIRARTGSPRSTGSSSAASTGRTSREHRTGHPAQRRAASDAALPARDWDADRVVPNRVAAPSRGPTFLEHAANNAAARGRSSAIQTDDVTDPIVERHGPSPSRKKAILSRLNYAGG